MSMLRLLGMLDWELDDSMGWTGWVEFLGLFRVYALDIDTCIFRACLMYEYICFLLKFAVI